MLKANGTGDLFVNLFGAIFEKQMNNDRFTVDTGHIVAFTDGLTYNTKVDGDIQDGKDAVSLESESLMT
ncbi:MAG: AIM24 family protein [Ignavibacteria bacterium]|jgi:uncharacterized protein (AIM24 family)|nr:AIM24 family protein [Ignavibacteria bacterium]